MDASNVWLEVCANVALIYSFGNQIVKKKSEYRSINIIQVLKVQTSDALFGCKSDEILDGSHCFLTLIC